MLGKAIESALVCPLFGYLTRPFPYGPPSDRSSLAAKEGRWKMATAVLVVHRPADVRHERGCSRVLRQLEHAHAATESIEIRLTGHDSLVRACCEWGVGNRDLGEVAKNVAVSSSGVISKSTPRLC